MVQGPAHAAQSVLEPEPATPGGPTA
jgi:hypothetical protein